MAENLQSGQRAPHESADRTLEKWRKSWMHPCVRCVSNLRVRCGASRPCFAVGHKGRQRSSSLTSEGFFAIMASSTWAGPLGCLRPCSQLSSVPLATPMLRAKAPCDRPVLARSEEHTSELQSLMRISYAVFCLKKKKKTTKETNNTAKQ